MLAATMSVPGLNLIGLSSIDAASGRTPPPCAGTVKFL
jgi:hypothetical protein